MLWPCDTGLTVVVVRSGSTRHVRKVLQDRFRRLDKSVLGNGSLVSLLCMRRKKSKKKQGQTAVNVRLLRAVRPVGKAKEAIS
jgi:hypothetical protein